MKIYVFGNEDTTMDNKPFIVISKLKKDQNFSKFLTKIEFVHIGINKDLPFDKNENVVIMDTIDGIEEITQIEDSDLDKLITPNSTSVHDFDLGFQLKYLKKLGKLGTVTIIGIPMDSNLAKKDYLRIQLTLRKLVAQDIQGS